MHILHIFIIEKHILFGGKLLLKQETKAFVNGMSLFFSLLRRSAVSLAFDTGLVVEAAGAAALAAFFSGKV